MRIALALSLVVTSGCPYFVSFREGLPEPIQGWPAAQETRLSIVLAIEGKSIEPAVRAETIRAYNESGLFSVVQPGDTSDVRAEIVLSQKNDSDYEGAVIDIFFGLVPIHQSSTAHEMVTTFTPESGEPISITRIERSETWSHLLLIPLFPFKNPWRVERQIFYDLARQTILDAQKAGTFSR